MLSARGIANVAPHFRRCHRCNRRQRPQLLPLLTAPPGVRGVGVPQLAEASHSASMLCVDFNNYSSLFSRIPRDSLKQNVVHVGAETKSTGSQFLVEKRAWVGEFGLDKRRRALASKGKCLSRSGQQTRRQRLRGLPKPHPSIRVNATTVGDSNSSSSNSGRRIN